MILKMNFNFNFKDMLALAGQSIRVVTNVRDLHHTGKSGIKRKCACKMRRNRNLSDILAGANVNDSLTSSEP